MLLQSFDGIVRKKGWFLLSQDPAFIKQSEEFAITKFKDWIIEQIT